MTGAAVTVVNWTSGFRFQRGNSSTKLGHGHGTSSIPAIVCNTNHVMTREPKPTADEVMVKHICRVFDLTSVMKYAVF